MGSTWFVRGGGKVYGPLDSSRLKQLAVDGKIAEHTEVAGSAGGPWIPAGNVRGLFPAAEATRLSPSPAMKPQSSALATDTAASFATAAAAETDTASSPRQAEPFGQWYRRKIGGWHVAIQVLAWMFGGYLFIPLWWAFSGNAPLLKIGKWVGAVFAVMLAFTVVIEFVDPEGMKQRREERAKAAAEWRENNAAQKPSKGNLKGAHVAAGLAAIELKNSGAIRPRGDVLNALARRAANELQVEAERRDEFVRDFEWAFNVAWDKSK